MRQFISILYVAALSIYSHGCVCLNGLVCSVCCRFAFVHRYHADVQHLLCVSLQKHFLGGCHRRTAKMCAIDRSEADENIVRKIVCVGYAVRNLNCVSLALDYAYSLCCCCCQPTDRPKNHLTLYKAVASILPLKSFS